MTDEEAEPVLTVEQAAAAAQKARYELADTLDAIEDKLNPVKQAQRASRPVQDSMQRNPIAWVIGSLAAVVVVAGLITWAVLSDDD